MTDQTLSCGKCSVVDGCECDPGPIVRDLRTHIPMMRKGLWRVSCGHKDWDAYAALTNWGLIKIGFREQMEITKGPTFNWDALYRWPHYLRFIILGLAAWAIAGSALFAIWAMIVLAFSQ